MIINEYTRAVIKAAMRVHPDLLVNGVVVVEVKAVGKLLPIHHAQLLSYLRLSGHKIGLLINFNVRHLRDGINRMVNGL